MGSLRFRAWQDSGVIYLTDDMVSRYSEVDRRFKTLDYSKKNPNDLAFILGFMASRVQTAAAKAAEIERVKQELKAESAKLPAGVPLDITKFSLRFQDIQLRNAALAYTQGWTAVLSAAEQAKGRRLEVAEVGNLLMKSRSFSVSVPRFPTLTSR